MDFMCGYLDLNINYANLMFINNNASISIIEKYNSCPKSAFLANGLKLKKVKNEKIEANIIGALIHEVAELFVKNNKKQLGSLNDEQINFFVDKIIEKVVNDEKFYSILLDENQFVFNLIKKECKRFCAFNQF